VNSFGEGPSEGVGDDGYTHTSSIHSIQTYTCSLVMDFARLLARICSAVNSPQTLMEPR